jgi:tetratricopeptide (TPR) repeat protein
MVGGSAAVELAKAVIAVTLFYWRHVPGQNVIFARQSSYYRFMPCASKNYKAHNLRLTGGLDYSRWDDLDAGEEQEDENRKPLTFEDNMNLIHHHSGKEKFENDEEEGLDEAEEDDDADWQCNLGDMESGAGLLDRAERAFQRALQINQTHVQSLVSYGNLLIEKKEYARAEGMFATALRLDPTNIQAEESLKALEDDDIA